MFAYHLFCVDRVVSDARLGDAEARALARSLQTNTTLTTLNLSGTRIIRTLTLTLSLNATAGITDSMLCLCARCCLPM